MKRQESECEERGSSYRGSDESTGQPREISKNTPIFFHFEYAKLIAVTLFSRNKNWHVILRGLLIPVFFLFVGRLLRKVAKNNGLEYIGKEDYGSSNVMTTI